jgi:hypothetical protein
LVDLVELYDASYLPGSSGFDPDDAVERFASEEITWGGNAYRREVTSLGRSDVSRSMGSDQNNVTITFSNISRYLATLAQSRTMEGLFCVVRTVNPTVTDDSVVLFTGRLEKPSTINKKTFYVSARQDFGAININLPTSKFLTTDPNNRVPSDPLFEGFRIVPVAGSFTTERSVPSTSFWGRLFARQKKEKVSEQYSSLDDTPYGSAVPEIFGSCQMEGIPLLFIDYGSITRGIWVWSKGPIAGIDNVAFRNDGQILRATTNHLGDLGGTGSNATEESDIATGIGFLSLTAYTAMGWNSLLEEVDNAPTVIALIRGRLVDLPDSSGVFNQTGWSNNNAHIARFIMTNSRFMNINAAFMEDSVNYLTGLHCDEPLIDDTNSEIITIPSPDLPQAGETFYRYQSSGIYSSRYFRYNHLGEILIEPPEVVDGPYTSFNPTDIPTTFTVQNLLRKRYTCNVPITGEVRAVDFLYNTIFPSFKGFLRVNKKGKYEIRSEQSADSTRLRTATAVGATSIPVDDVTPWKSGPDLLQGRILLGVHLTTSEVRDVSSADYSTAGNSVTLTAGITGDVTATASGATLSGGSTSVQASGTVTIGGTPEAGNSVTITINGIAVTYTVGFDETTGTVAAMLTQYINATPRLRGFIKATWGSGTPTIITIKAKYGALNLSSPLLKAHAIGVADPSVAPTITATGSGALAAGDYSVAYANVTAYGLTALTPVSTVTLTANQQIAVSSLPALPAGVTSRQFFVSEEIGSTRLRYAVTRTNASDFNINALPLANAALPPSFNTTSEELIRIAMSFATNSQDVLPAWRSGITPTVADIYLPTALNGHKYTATSVSGATGASEPTWPTSAGGTVVDGGVTWTESGETVLGQAGLTRSNVIKDSFNWPLGSEQSSINQIKIEFRDRKNDFALTPYLVNDFTHQAQVGKPYPMEVDGSAIDNFHQMFRIANGALAKYRDGDWFVTWATGPQGLVLEEGDVCCVSDDSGGLINVPVRIEALSIAPNHEVTISRARKYSTNQFSDDARAQTVPIPSNLRFVQTVNSVIEFLDTPALRPQDGFTPGFYVSVSRDLDDMGDWRGWSLYADYGDGYMKVAEGDLPALIGETISTLDDVADPDTFDTSNDLTFTLKYAADPIAFGTVSEADLIANPRRNLFLVGDELIQAATIVDNGNRSFTISDLYHGRFETSCVVHSIGERVVYIDGSEVFVPIDPSRLGIEYNYKAVTTNQDVSTATMRPFTWNGNILRPARVSDVLAAMDGSNDWLIKFVGHPYPSIEPSFTVEVWDEDFANMGGSLPVTVGSTHATVLNATNKITNTDGDIVEDGIGKVHTEHTDKNNLFGYRDAEANQIKSKGVSIEYLDRTWQRFDFTFQWLGTDGYDIATLVEFIAKAGLQTLSSTDTSGDIPGFADCPLAVEWTAGPRAGLVTETYYSFGVEIGANDVDPGYGSGTGIDNVVVSRKGRRYTFLLSGTEYRLYVDYTGASGQKPIAIVSNEGAFASPLRFVSQVFANQVSAFNRPTMACLNIVTGGNLDASTIFSARDQIGLFGDVQDTIYLKIYQNGPYGIEGVPYYLVAP